MTTIFCAYAGSPRLPRNDQRRQKGYLNRFLQHHVMPQAMTASTPVLGSGTTPATRNPKLRFPPDVSDSPPCRALESRLGEPKLRNEPPRKPRTEAVINASFH